MILSKKQILYHILEHLNSDHRLLLSDIYVDVKDGRVILTGMVPSILAKKIAEENAYIVPQVLYVDNYLKVRNLEDHQPGADHILRIELEQAIHLDGNLFHQTISVIALKGIITLEGSVDIYWKKILAEKIVLSFKEVKEVINNISVFPAKRVLDEIIARRIMIRLARIKSIQVTDLTIHVLNGIVTAKGLIHDDYTASLVKKMILSTIGVYDLNDKLIRNKK